VHYVRDVRQIHTAEPLVPVLSLLQVEIAIARLKYKSPGTEQIPAEMFLAGGDTLVFVIYKLTRFVWNEEQLRDQWMEPII
jgi:hypothetical protein